MNAKDHEKQIDSTVSSSVEGSDDERVTSTGQISPKDGKTLYSDVVVDPVELEKEGELQFTVEDVELVELPSTKPFTVLSSNDVEDLEEVVTEIPKIIPEPKLYEEIRQEPKLGLINSDEFSATATNNLETEQEESFIEEAPTEAIEIPKKRKGSKLGMGWFQGFNLFILGVIFVGLAIFAYFMFGDESLYSGRIPKYVVIENEESGSMAALNPAIPDAERQSYIYVPKAPRITEEEFALEQTKPLLDPIDQTAQVTTIGANSQNPEETVTEEVVRDETTSTSSGLTLLSVDHNAEGLSQEDLALVEGYLLQGDIAFTQGNYVGVNQDDAYYYYMEALGMDPVNAKAQQGLRAIADVYYTSARDAYNYGNYDVAQQYLAIGLVVEPEHRPLLQLQQQLEQNSNREILNSLPSSNDGVIGGFNFY